MKIRHGDTTILNAKKAAARATYHHGDLRAALIAATEEVLLEHGVEAFSLRAAARRAGVSPAAPAYHFGDAAGLLTEVAIAGFEELTRFLRRWSDKGGKIPQARLRSQGEGYIRFALANRARFQLMFRKDKLKADPRLFAAAEESFACLQTAVCEAMGLPPSANPGPDVMILVLASWSIVHGFAHLLLDGQFDRMAEDRKLDKFLDATIPKLLQTVAVPTRSKPHE
jgi:AcrR family transcriptional regulator